MTPSAALTLARSLMREHGLVGWTVKVDRAKTRGGACHYDTRTLSLGANYLAHATDADIRNTILHEIAHALVGHDAGHGPVWQRKAREIGCNARRTHSVNTRANAPWRPVCAAGHQGTSAFHRAPLRVRFCGQCARTVKPEAAMTWLRDGRPVPVSAMPARYQAEVRSLRSRHGGRLAI